MALIPRERFKNGMKHQHQLFIALTCHRLPHCNKSEPKLRRMQFVNLCASSILYHGWTSMSHQFAANQTDINEYCTHSLFIEQEADLQQAKRNCQVDKRRTALQLLLLKSKMDIPIIYFTTFDNRAHHCRFIQNNASNYQAMVQFVNQTFGEGARLLHKQPCRPRFIHNQSDFEFVVNGLNHNELIIKYVFMNFSLTRARIYIYIEFSKTANVHP